MAIKKFTIDSTSGESFSLADHKGKKVLLYFYPKDNTPGCTREGVDFAAQYKQLTKLKTLVFGISRDSIASHQKFRAKMNFPFHLLSDPEEIACEAFGVMKMKNMYGKKVRGIERSTFLFDEAGKLLKEWRGVKVDGHVDEVIEYLHSL